MSHLLTIRSASVFSDTYSCKRTDAPDCLPERCVVQCSMFLYAASRHLLVILSEQQLAILGHLGIFLLTSQQLFDRLSF